MLMLNERQRDIVRDKGTIFGRILIGLFFLTSGVFMVTNYAGTTAYFEGEGIPMAAVTVALVIAVKILAGGALIIGARVGLAAAMLIIFTVAASAVGHDGFNDPGLLKNLAIVGGLLYVMAYGKGGLIN
jgi:putative oxidoreductase